MERVNADCICAKTSYNLGIKRKAHSVQIHMGRFIVACDRTIVGAGPFYTQRRGGGGVDIFCEANEP